MNELLTSQQFGPALLLDTTWDVNKLRHTSKLFYRAYEVVKAGVIKRQAQEQEEQEDLQDEWDSLS
jgi:hypothetical protein